MAVPTRPYFIILNEKEHMVEASTQAAAIQHLIGGQVSELRPARATEVLAWNRAGKLVQTAGAKPAPAPSATESTPGVAREPGETDLVTVPLTPEEIAAAEAGPTAQQIIDSTVKFDGGDAIRWLEQDVGFNKSARATWDSIVASGRMTLEQFDAMRKTCGSFVAAVAFDPMQGNMAINVDNVRSSLETAPMPIETVIETIGDAVTRERADEIAMATND